LKSVLNGPVNKNGQAPMRSDKRRPNRCDCCGGKFGLVLHRSWGRRFCCKPCKWLHETQQERARRWVAFSPNRAGAKLDSAIFTMAPAHAACGAQPAIRFQRRFNDVAREFGLA
jgi:hypothetical protein